MAQERYFEFQADDATKALNEWMLGINNAGVYRGFDAIESRADLQVKLLHTTTKFTYKAIDYGIVITQEGVIVKESATVDIATINPTTQKRIDLLILTHTYQPATAGGEDALYSVIQGTEHPTTPVAPYISVPPNAVVLGELSLPALCTALNQVGVTFTRAKAPLYANDSSRLDAKANLVSGLVPIAEIPRIELVKNVANIAERDALVVWEGRRCFVIDASADSEIGSGSAEYVWIGAPSNIWKRVAKDELSRKADKNQGSFLTFTLNTGWTQDFTTGGNANEFYLRKYQWGTKELRAFTLRRTSGSDDAVATLIGAEYQPDNSGVSHVFPCIGFDASASTRKLAYVTIERTAIPFRVFFADNTVIAAGDIFLIPTLIYT